MKESRQRLKYIISDFLGANVAWFLFNLVRYYNLPYNYSQMSLDRYMTMHDVILGQIAFPVMVTLLYAISGYYNHVYFKSRLSEFLNTFGVSFISTILIFFVALFNDNIVDRLHNYEMILILWGLISLCTYIPRCFITASAMKRIKRGDLSFKTCIVGISPKSVNLARNISGKYPEMGINITGFAYVDNKDAIHNLDGTEFSDLDVIGLSDISGKDTVGNFDQFIVVPVSQDKMETVSVVNTLFPLGKPIYITPDLFHFITSRPRTSKVAGEVLVDITKSPVPAGTLNIKRICDVLFSSLAMVVLSPVFIAVAIAVKHNSPGPVIYKQERIGLNKKKFKIYKFRSMYVNSEPNGPQLSSANDNRITTVGRFIRKYRIDELPQFWNVIKGDMSLVGPRPEREYFLDKIIAKAPYFNLLHQVRPGITSWGMVKYGYAESVDEMIERYNYDLLYLDNLSIALDMKIMLYTIKTVVTGKGI